MSYFTERRLTKAFTTFDQLGLTDRIVSDNSSDSLADVLFKPVDYGKALSRERIYREQSMKFVNDLISESRNS